MSRLLHTMLRVANLDRSLRFYRALGMTEQRRERYPEGRFTLSFLGFGPEADHTVLELTHNWDTPGYEHGNGFGHIAVEVRNLRHATQTLAAEGGTVVRPPGPMKQRSDTSTRPPDVIAFVDDPDGYRVELIQAPNR